MPTILFTTVGSGSWVKPAGVTRVEIECWGAGGDGSATSPGRRGGGGGSYSANMSGLTTNYAATEMVIPYYVVFIIHLLPLNPNQLSVQNNTKTLT